MAKLYRIKYGDLYMTRGGNFVSAAPNAGQWETLEGAERALAETRERVMAQLDGSSITASDYVIGRGLRNEMPVRSAKNEPEIPFDGPYTQTPEPTGSGEQTEQTKPDEHEGKTKRPAK